MFRTREEAGLCLAGQLKCRPLHDPLVLGIPCGGAVVGAILAHQLGAEFDVVLARPINCPSRPELTVGAVGEDGEVYLTPYGEAMAGLLADYLHDAIRYQRVEITRQRRLFRAARSAAHVLGRSVIVTDEGLATSSTMLAALQEVRARNPRELIVAVPVASPQALKDIPAGVDQVICPLRPERFESVGQFYQDFRPVPEEQVLALLRPFALTLMAHPAWAQAPSPREKEEVR